MARVKSLVYHGKSFQALRDYYSIVYEDQMVYVLTVDGKIIERHDKPKKRSTIVKIVKSL